MKGCAFCKIYEKEGCFYEDKYFFSRFDTSPCTPGHANVLPKRHVVSLQDLTDDEWSFYLPAIKETISAIKKINLRSIYEKFLEKPPNKKSLEFCQDILKHPYLESKAEDHLIGWNDGKNAGRTIHHLHLHIIPAFSGDILPGGIRYSVEGKGAYK